MFLNPTDATLTICIKLLLRVNEFSLFNDDGIETVNFIYTDKSYKIYKQVIIINTAFLITQTKSRCVNNGREFHPEDNL